MMDGGSYTPSQPAAQPQPVIAAPVLAAPVVAKLTSPPPMPAKPMPKPAKAMKSAAEESKSQPKAKAMAAPQSKP